MQRSHCVCGSSLVAPPPQASIGFVAAGCRFHPYRKKKGFVAALQVNVIKQSSGLPVKTNDMSKKTDFKKLALNRWKLKWFFIGKMPLGFLAGMRVVAFDEEKAAVSIPYNYITKNPFRSVYFAAQSMAAELSSGVIAINEVMNAPLPVSMLVFNMDARFTKKARSKVVFTCNGVKEIKETVRNAVETGEGQTVTVTTTGVDAEGDVVSVFHFTWTFKTKSRKQNN